MADDARSLVRQPDSGAPRLMLDIAWSLLPTTVGICPLVGLMVSAALIKLFAAQGA